MAKLRKINFDANKLFKRFLLISCLGTFLIMFIQEVRPFRTVKPLKGYFIPKVYSPFSFESWLSGDYQQTAEDYLKEDFGFRNFLVRFDNEIRFLLFNETKTEAVIIGKDNYLYEYGYIMAYNGKEFMGEKTIQDSVARIKLLQDSLNSMGKQLLIVMAPSKVRIYPEYISDSLNPDPEHLTNYKVYKKCLDQAGVNYIDFNVIFEAKKAKSQYLLFPQLGIHWSRLEAVRAADTIVKRLASLSHSNLPEINIISTPEKNLLQDPDDDIVSSMNLLRYPPYRKMAYPEFEIIKENKELKDLIMVADSYWWDIFLSMIPKQMFSSNEFWYYDKEIWGSNFFGKKSIEEIDIKRRILQNDYIVIMGTESNLSRLGYGFFGQAINALRRTITPSKEELSEINKLISSNSKWKEEITQKAALKKISYEEMCNLDANWYFQNHGPVKHGIDFDYMKAYIFANKEWLQEVTRKAAERKISVDSMVTEDALWALKNENNISKNNTTTELSTEKIKDKIRHDYEWMSQIREKATKRGISVDSMISIDAVWFVKEQKAKN